MHKDPAKDGGAHTVQYVPKRRINFMNKKWLTMLLTASMVASLGTTVAFAEEETEAAPSAVTTVGPDDATHFELWSFVDVHNEFYANMVNEWNEQNPDKQVQITFSTYPYSDMHNKLMMSL